MKKKTLESCGTNSGKVDYNPKTSREMEIKRGKYSFGNGFVHPLFNGEDKYFKRIDSLEMDSKVIYYFMLFGKKESVSGVHIGFNFWEHQRFLWLQNSHWLQKEENIRYVINVFFLLMGLYVGFLKK